MKTGTMIQRISLRDRILLWPHLRPYDYIARLPGGQHALVDRNGVGETINTSEMNKARIAGLLLFAVSGTVLLTGLIGTIMR